MIFDRWSVEPNRPTGRVNVHWTIASDNLTFQFAARKLSKCSVSCRWLIQSSDIPSDRFKTKDTEHEPVQFLDNIRWL